MINPHLETFLFLFILIVFPNRFLAEDQLPTVYEYYTKGGIKSGLEAEGVNFKLNGKELRILSGSLHYFRLLPSQWQDRLLRMKAAGLNTIQFLSPWNLHEEHPNEFNFKNGLDLDTFLTQIKQADMLALYRPGPYICGEWDNGGIPSWLMRDNHLQIRTNYGPYINASANYLNQLFPIIKKHLFQNGGPIIGIQLDNEYAALGNTKNNVKDYEYMKFLKDSYIKAGINTLLFTCDNSYANHLEGSLDGIFKAANFWYPGNVYNDLRKRQPNKPLYVSEFWTGWYAHWNDKVQTSNLNKDQKYLETILFQFNGSVNFYMFYGGTNFGFMNDATITTKYVYYTPLSEDGNYYANYWKIKETFEKLEKEGKIPKLKKLQPPKVESKANYGSINITHCLSLNEILSHVNPVSSIKPLQMEMINLTNKTYGQNFGYIHYRKLVPHFKKLKFEKIPNDRAIVIINNVFVKEIKKNDQDFINKDHLTINVDQKIFQSNVSQNSLDILVENMGRTTNYGHKIILDQRKGINGKIFIDDKEMTNWKIFPLEFKQDFVKKLSNVKWRIQCNLNSIPGIYKANLVINGQPKDTFLKADGWTKGNAFINGFNVGRYWNVGPQKTLYIPSQLLNDGNNDVYLFETLKNSNKIQFVDHEVLG